MNNTVSNSYLIFIGTSVLLLMGLGLIVFVVVYQRRQFRYRMRQQSEIQAIHEEMQRKLLENALHVQEEVRKNIAKDLHDEVGALLSATKMGFNLFTKNLKNDDTYSNGIASTKNMLDEAILTVRRISKELVPVTLENFGLIAAIEDFVQKVAKTTDLDIHFQCNLEEAERLESKQELMLYRIIQELTNNALKHAEATQIDIILRKDEEKLLIDFVDNGKGFSIETVEKDTKNGLGLNNIKSRVNVVQGKYMLRSGVGEGTHIHIEIPT